MPRSSNGAVAALRVGLAVQCLVAALLAWRFPTPINSVLFLEAGLAEETATLVDTLLAGLLAILAVAVLGRPRVPALAAVTAIFLGWAAAEAWSHSDLVGRMAVPAHAVRWLAPVGLAFLLEPTEHRLRLGGWTLRVAIATTFLVHGWEALRHHPPFLDLLLGGARRLGVSEAVDLDEARARTVLTVIGWLDVAVAAGVLLVRSRLLALWMCLWGFLTAASRWLELGDDGLLQSFLRTMNGATPLALFYLWRRGRDRA